MLIRFFLLYLISFSVFADCPAGESIGYYSLSTPTTFCADYIGNHCAVVCGWSSGQAAVCVGSATQQGPYRLTGASCKPHEPGGTVDCSLTPSDPSCFITPPDCTANPTDPACSSGGGNDGGNTGGGNTGGGSTGGNTGGGVADTGAAHCGTGVGCTFNPKGYFTSSSESDYGMHQIHDVLESLTTVTTFSGNAANRTLNSISDSLNELSGKYQSNATNASNSTLKTNDYLADIKWRLDNPVSSSGGSTGGSSGSSGSSSIDYSARLDALINGLNSMRPFLDSRFTILDSEITSLNSLYGLSYDQRSLQRNIAQSLTSVDSKLSSVISELSGLGGTGSGGGEGSGTGSSVGTADNPAHLAPSFYQACLDCFVDVDGAQSELEASKEKLKTTIKTIQTDFKSIFTFDSSAGSGSSSIASCWDFGEFVGQQCLQLDETWALLKALVLFIFMIAIIFMFTRGNN